jgi:hypothetical protein
VSDVSTPRTDAAAWTTNYAEVEVVDSDFARQLELELAEATKQRDALATALCQVLDNDGVLVRTAAREALATLEGRTE